MRARYFNSKENISTTRLLATLKLACDRSWNHESALMLVLPHYVHDALAIKLNSPMLSVNRTALIVGSVRSDDWESPRLFRSYREMINYLSKTMYATDHAIAEFDAANLPYIQPANNNP